MREVTVLDRWHISSDLGGTFVHESQGGYSLFLDWREAEILYA